MARERTETFGGTVVVIKTHRLVQVNPLHPTNSHPAIAVAYVGGEQLADANDQPVEKISGSEELAEAAMITDLETRLGART